jgi:alpha-amylase
LAFAREKSGKTVIYVANLTKDHQSFTVAIEGTYLDYMTGKKVTFKKGDKLEYKPWEYHILVK